MLECSNALGTAMRQISFYEWSANPEGGEALAYLGTGPFDGVLSRQVVTPRVSCFFSHRNNDYLRSFASFGTTRFNFETNEFEPTSFRDSYERTGGPLWLMTLARDNLIEAWACLPEKTDESQDSYWVEIPYKEPPFLITATQALAELSGEKAPDQSFVVYLHFQGASDALATLIEC